MTEFNNITGFNLPREISMIIYEIYYNLEMFHHGPIAKKIKESRILNLKNILG
jgi:hypothetical protein